MSKTFWRPSDLTHFAQSFVGKSRHRTTMPAACRLAPSKMAANLSRFHLLSSQRSSDTVLRSLAAALTLQPSSSCFRAMVVGECCYRHRGAGGCLCGIWLAG